MRARSEGVELATLDWLHWHKSSRLHAGHLDDVPPAEVEEAFHAYERMEQPMVATR